MNNEQKYAALCTELYKLAASSNMANSCVAAMLIRKFELEHPVDSARPLSTISVAGFTWDKRMMLVHDRCRRIHLSATEFKVGFELFAAYARDPDRVITRADIIACVWGTTEHVKSRTLEQHIYKLRGKLKLSAHDRGVEIRTIYGHGVQLVVFPNYLQPQEATSHVDQS